MNGMRDRGQFIQTPPLRHEAYLGRSSTSIGLDPALVRLADDAKGGPSTRGAHDDNGLVDASEASVRAIQNMSSGGGRASWKRMGSRGSQG